jgi:hypothetical protein
MLLQTVPVGQGRSKMLERDRAGFAVVGGFGLSLPSAVSSQVSVCRQLMPEFGEKGKENFTCQFGFFVRLSVPAIRKVSKI